MTPDPDQTPGEDPKLASLETRLDAARRTEAERTAAPKQAMGMTNTGARTGQRVLSTLVGYPLGGGVIGWFLDGFFHTRPWIMLALLFLAFAGACFQVFSISKEPSE
ncbi:AtpZ/AtpI family protein [Sphingomonas sp.]|uniref:AtpZ/AtpI family protein n=1 Tax=Sphingomonas sp. TaxID=28214 RepID=UPI002E37A50A|nr:AtpZ/AtpI family protein [Sphingomonas sp.]HEX4693307.1 AtpZ/AtpI family protein [Sphingomonas sp.]